MIINKEAEMKPKRSTMVGRKNGDGCKPLTRDEKWDEKFNAWIAAKNEVAGISKRYGVSERIAWWIREGSPSPYKAKLIANAMKGAKP